jgi:hypothetical protein
VWNLAQRWLRVLPLAACALLAWSALDFRFAPSLRKEDYRSAVQFVRPVVAAGRPVWWLASAYPAIFYGVDITFFDSEPGKLFLAYHAREDVHTLPPPDLIVVNKPDLHDPDGTVQKIIANNHYTVAARYQAFTVWTNAAAKPETGNLKPD